ncbi:MAG: type II toxin-antitoxin system HicB family antitoxin [Peptococcaceae bacterium]|nr:type II toxin-antitoxin system HicB family antitoxin [Peptococcaceae bacterium]
MKLPERYCYPAVFTYEDGYQIAVEFPDLDVATCGEDDEEALFSARELLGLVMFGREEDGEDIPEPSDLLDVKLAPNERAMLVDVYMPSIRMSEVNRSVKRTVTLPAWLNAKAMENDINFSQVLQQALKQQLHLS